MTTAAGEHHLSYLALLQALYRCLKKDIISSNSIFFLMLLSAVVCPGRKLERVCNTITIPSTPPRHCVEQQWGPIAWHMGFLKFIGRISELNQLDDGGVHHYIYYI